MPEEVKTINDLISKIRTYNASVDTEFLEKAYFYSSEAHQRQKRNEGTPYFEHPLAVASILADMRMDTTTIVAGLLHDTVEDTDVTAEEIWKLFGNDVSFLVKSLTKLSRIEFKSREEAQAENFRKMLLSVAKDVRVIMIKFADRLHNMRTLQFLPDNKRARIAKETLEIYAPLANRLGIGWLKTEFEDLSFKYMMPTLYDEIEGKVAQKRSEYQEYIEEVKRLIKEKVTEAGINAKVYGRVKHFFGIYQKMQVQRIPFEEVYDVLGLRIITDTKTDCYVILGIIHSLWTPVPGRFKDYIGTPKSNKYQSLHTTVIGPRNERVEFQIRTEEMDRIAEDGIASHWRYKEKSGVREKDDRHIKWLRELVGELKNMSDAKDIMDTLKDAVVSHDIYIFTPKGDVQPLPEGSTPVDFAYSIHTEVGNRCVGAKINGRIVPLKYKLQSGDAVEIITSPSHTPSRDWLSFTVTQKARARIKHWIKIEERKQGIEIGTKLLETELRKHSLSPSLLKSDLMTPLIKQFNVETVEDIIASVGFGKLTPVNVVKRLSPEKVIEEEHEKRPERKQKESKGILIKGVNGIMYHTAKCCYPVPGDSLIGVVTRGRGVAVHRKDCANLANLPVDVSRLVDVDWKPETEYSTQTRIILQTVDRPGVMKNVSAAISAMSVNISRLEATTTPDGFARIVLNVEVKDRPQLQSIMTKMTQLEGVLSVRR